MYQSEELNERRKPRNILKECNGRRKVLNTTQVWGSSVSCKENVS